MSGLAQDLTCGCRQMMDRLPSASTCAAWGWPSVASRGFVLPLEGEDGPGFCVAALTDRW